MLMTKYEASRELFLAKSVVDSQSMICNIYKLVFYIKINNYINNGFMLRNISVKLIKKITLQL